MSRVFCIPGIFFLFCAFVLSFLASISLPFLTVFDVARVHFGEQAVASGDSGITQLRFGVWAHCEYNTDGDRTCSKAGHGYSVDIASPSDSSDSVIIGPNWTRGLAVHPVATGVTFIALGLSFSTHVTVTLIASIVSFLSAIITLIAFAIDIALFAFVKHQVNKLDNVNGSTKPGPGFWLTFASLILLFLGGCTVCLGRRRQRSSGATSYPMTSPKKSIWSRFRKN